MSKLTKLVRHPLSFFQDAWHKPVNPQGKTAEQIAQGQERMALKKKKKKAFLDKKKALIEKKKAEAAKKKAFLEKKKALFDKKKKDTNLKKGGKPVVAKPGKPGKFVKPGKPGKPVKGGKPGKVAPPAKPVAVVGKDVESAVPAWFQSDVGPELRRALAGSKPVFLYIPWIAEHGNMLIDRIADNKTYSLAGLDFIRGVEDNELRRGVLRFARANPHLYRRMIARRLVPLRNRINGVIFTFDWAPVMRIIASVCEELEIPRILIPHESVFVDREKYYWDPTAQASIPVADVTLGWGGMQREIFVERGYPAQRFQAVGAPKFDPYKNYKPQLSRAQYCRLFGLDPAKKIIIFASQPLDSQLNIKIARKCQCDAIGDLLDIAEAKGMQLVVRLPPSKDNILEPALQKRMERSSAGVIDDALCYLVSPEEALYHADLVTSVNSTMLFEGLLIGRPPLSVKYVAFDSIWAQAGIPAANNKEELIKLVDEILFSETPWQPSEEGVAWAAGMFSQGEFDGRASFRIKEYLRELATEESQLTIRPKALERLFARDNEEGNINLVASTIPEEVWAKRYKYLLPMLKARARLNSGKGIEDARTLASVDVFIQTGPKPNLQQAEVQSALGRSKVIVEPGFIRSVKGEPAELSIYLDDTSPHYDATRTTRLQRLLESDQELSEEQIDRARTLIHKIVRNRIYDRNKAPYLPLTIGTPGWKKALVVDQLQKDNTLSYGLANAASFETMLRDAVNRMGPECDVIIQRPPSAKGKKGSFYSDRSLPFLEYMKNLYPVTFDVNPFALVDLADEVFVVNSHLGFEALLAGKTVHCFGAPFYAGWGATQDHITIPGRTRRRTVEEIFHFAYIESSRYFHPELNKVVELEELLDYVIARSEPIVTPPPAAASPEGEVPAAIGETPATEGEVPVVVTEAPITEEEPLVVVGETPAPEAEIIETPIVEEEVPSVTVETPVPSEETPVVVVVSGDEETDLDEIERVEQDELDLPKLEKDVEFDQAEDNDLDLSELPKKGELDLEEEEEGSATPVATEAAPTPVEPAKEEEAPATPVVAEATPSPVEPVKEEEKPAATPAKDDFDLIEPDEPKPAAPAADAKPKAKPSPADLRRSAKKKKWFN